MLNFFLNLMIKPALTEDLAEIKRLTERCAQAMADKGIYQWNEHYPSKEKLAADIKKKDTNAIGYKGEWENKKAIKLLIKHGILTSKPNPKISKRPNKKLRSGERIKTGFGCHKGVAEVKILQNNKEVDTQTAETPRYADGGIYTLGPEMEACNALWSKVVEDSKKQSDDMRFINDDIPSVLNKG